MKRPASFGPTGFVASALVAPLAACASASTPASAPSVPAAASSSPPPPPIVQIGAPVLRARATDVPKEQIATPEFQALVARMIESMRNAPGVGLAAPQIGVPWRVIVLEDRPELLATLSDVERVERERAPFGPKVFVNPVLRPIGDARATFFEGCLSVRGYVGMVERALEVEVTGLDEHGAEQVWRVHGWPARILQHEVDHLDGTIYVDRMLTRTFTQADEAKARFGGRPIAEIRALLGLPSDK